MIIDDVHKFAFVHIPKCAGTSVRKQIEHLDSYQGRFAQKQEHPKLGRIDAAHLPLSFIQEHYPAEIQKIRDYVSFALVRNPHDRFFSALLQRLREFKKLSPSDFTAERILAEAYDVIDWLEDKDIFCDFEYIHFSKQVSYINLDGEEIVCHLFAMENLDLFSQELQKRWGISIESDRRENQSFVSGSSWIQIMQSTLRPFYSTFLGPNTRNTIAEFMNSVGLNAPAQPLYKKALEDAKISSFIENFYADDIALYHQLVLRDEYAPREADARASSASSQLNSTP